MNFQVILRVRGRVFSYSTSLEDKGEEVRSVRETIELKRRAHKKVFKEMETIAPAKFCRACGKEMIGRIATDGFDPQTGESILVAYGTCPDAKDLSDYDLRPSEHLRLTCKGEW